jgi:hypothetical protein
MDHSPLVEVSGHGTNGNGGGNGTDLSQQADVSDSLEKWASRTGNPARARSLYELYVSQFHLSPDQARLWVEDSIRIDREVEREFTT